MLPILIFVSMSVTAYKLLFGHMRTTGLMNPRGDCQVPIQGKQPSQLQYLGGYAPKLEKSFLCSRLGSSPSFPARGYEIHSFCTGLPKVLPCDCRHSVLRGITLKTTFAVGLPCNHGGHLPITHGGCHLPCVLGIISYNHAR